MSEGSTAPRWDPTDPAFRTNPYPEYELLRTGAPAFVRDDGVLVISRYADISRTLRSPDVSRDLTASATVDPDDPVAVRRQRRALAKTILDLDPPDHTRLRRLVSKAFTPRAVDRLAERIATMTDEALDQAGREGQIELIDEVAFPIPFNVISELLGVPIDRSEELRSWSQTLTDSLEPDATVEDLDAAEAAIWKLVPFLVEITNARRTDPQDDLISALLAVEDDGDTLSGEELLSFIVLLYVAGHETTVNLIGNAMVSLLERPDELRRWREDPSLDFKAIDELLRFDGPVQYTIRIPVTPLTFEFADHPPAVAEPGQVVLCILGSANRDPAHFSDPDRLVLDRPNAASHMSFGSGIHHCLGASLARLEATTVLTRIIRRFPQLELAAEPRLRDRLTIRGVDRLDLTLGRPSR